MFVQITCTCQRFITEIALDFTTFICDVSFQITCCVEDSRARLTFEFLFITNTPCHVTAPTIVWNLFLTVVAGNFPVRLHVCLQLRPSFACLFTLLTSEHTVIMLCCNVHPQMFVRGGFKPAYSAGRHGDCKFVLLTIFLDVGYDDISLQKTNMQVLNLDPKILVDYGTLESKIRERCRGKTLTSYHLGGGKTKGAQKMSPPI